MLHSLFGNPKTTAAGAAMALGKYLSTLGTPGWTVLGEILTYVGMMFLGVAASDAKPPAP